MRPDLQRPDRHTAGAAQAQGKVAHVSGHGAQLPHGPSAAKRVGVHPNTPFRWRHCFLDRVKDELPERLVGIVEADEMFLLESQKGARKLDRKPRKRGGRAALRGISHHLDCILVARDRSGRTIDAVTGRGALRMAQLVKHLLPKLDPQGCWSPMPTPPIPPLPVPMASPTRQSISVPTNASATRRGRHPCSKRQHVSPSLQGMAGALPWCFARPSAGNVVHGDVWSSLQSGCRPIRGLRRFPLSLHFEFRLAYDRTRSVRCKGFSTV